METCVRCKKEFRLIGTSNSFKEDGLCGKCRGRQKYLDNVDKYRKTNVCPTCGKKILKSSKYCNTCSQIGNKNHQWKEEKEDRRFYSTIGYRNWRKEILKQFHNKCVMCNSTYRLAAHHIYPKRRFPDKRFDLDNGVALCHKHHSQVHFKELEYINFFNGIMAEIKLCELGEGCNANTEPSHKIVEGVTTRDEINFPTSAGQPH